MTIGKNTRNRRLEENAKRQDDDASRVEARPPRVPLHERNILTVEGKDPNKEYRWVTDKDNRLKDFIAAWWEFETDDFLGVGDKTVNPTTQTGQVICQRSGERTMYFMSIARELYERDQNAKIAALEESENALYEELNSGKDGTYGEVKRETPF